MFKLQTLIKLSVVVTYHYHYRGSTASLTDKSDNVTDTFAYDTYSKQIKITVNFI